MNKKIFFFFLLTISIGLMSFQFSKSIQKKVNKEIQSTFDIKEFVLEPISIPENVKSEFKKYIRRGQFFKINKDSAKIGYCFVGQAPSKADDFDYLVLFDNEKITKKVKVLIYREDYGAEIGSTRWLKQFIGFNKSDKINYSQDIRGISGATISARALTIEVNNLLQSIAILDQKNILN